MRDLNHAISSCNFNIIIFTATNQLPAKPDIISHDPHLLITDLSLILLGSSLGAILPDIDHEYSNIHFYMQPFSKVFKKHRAITHSLIALIAIILINYSLAHLLPSLNLLFYSISLGYFWHLLEDDRSKAGILWFYPLTQYQKGKTANTYYKKRKNWHFTYKSSGLFEYCFAWFNLILFIVLISRLITLLK